MDYKEIIETFRKNYNQKNIDGMARFGISSKNTFGIPVPVLRKIAKDAGKNHELALQLWKSGIHEARILASMVDVPDKITENQMECWARDFDSWDICDQCCMNLFSRTKFAFDKVFEWTARSDEFVKRAGFALIAVLAVHDKEANDAIFLEFLKLVRKHSADKRNFVKKAVNWALRQTGKRNLRLNREAVKAAKIISRSNSKAAKWISSDAIRELTNPAVINRIKPS